MVARMTKVIVLVCNNFREVLIFCDPYSSLELHVLHIYHTLIWYGVTDLILLYWVACGEQGTPTICIH